MVKIGTVGSVDVAAVIPLALKRPNVLQMIGALILRPSQKALVVTVQIALVGHFASPCFPLNI
jgi:hypothetical protein